MAVDEAILNAIAEGQSPPTLRFFGWEPPCLSLGYAQPVSDVDRERLAARGWHLVRRPTGGRAILHTDELTYSVIAPMDEPRVLGGVVESYRRLSQGLLGGLEILGLTVRADKTKKSQSPTPKSQTQKGDAQSFSNSPILQSSNPVCFEAPSDYEITANGQKLIGSAQVRKRGVVLQHGTLPLTGDITRICDALKFETEAERSAAKARVRERAITIAEVLGREVRWAEAARSIQHGFAERLNLSFGEGALSAFEQEQMRKLREEKYAAERWNGRV